MKQIIVNVSGLSEEEKQRVNEALAKITGALKMPAIILGAAWFLAPSSTGSMAVTWAWRFQIEEPTHTPQQVLEMAGMAEQGHAHAELMAQYAEDALTHPEPWKLWEMKLHFWVDCHENPLWQPDIEYRRKPKTHTVNGVEVPDLRVAPKSGEWYWYPDASIDRLATGTTYWLSDTPGRHRSANDLCYEYTEGGKQAAILHAKAWLGIA